MAINHFIIYQKRISDRIIEDNAHSLTDLDKNNPSYKILYYKNKEDFLKENPQCCKLAWYLPEDIRQPFSYRAKGFGDGYVHLLYNIRYLDKNNNEKRFLVDNIYYQVTNCGHVTYLFYYSSCLIENRARGTHEHCNYN